MATYSEPVLDLSNADVVWPPGRYKDPPSEKDTGEVTLYVDRGEYESSLKKASAKQGALYAAAKSLDGQCKVQVRDQVAFGRFHAVSCFGGKQTSVTIRSKNLTELAFRPTVPCGFALPVRADQQYPSNKILNDAVKDHAKRGRGLVLIAGETSAGKTVTLNHLLTEYLATYGSKRVPHLVALGDPVETFLYHKKDSLDSSWEGLSGTRDRPFDYTPRVIGCDVDFVKDGLQDALRETPAAVVVSELRTPDDIKAALNFAATGHLIFATCHSGSLVEVFAKLLEAFQEREGSKEGASVRSALVSRLAAVMHIEKLGGKYFPSVWRPTPRGRQAFVSEGLSSIIPTSPAPGGSPRLDDVGVLGRYWMFQKLGLPEEIAVFVEERPYTREQNAKCELQADIFGRDLKGA